MTVELNPKCNHCFLIGVANETFFSMVNDSGMSDVIGEQKTNDPITVTSDQAMKCREKLRAWTPPNEWGGGFQPEKMKKLFDEFFTRCDGFSTR